MTTKLEDLMVLEGRERAEAAYNLQISRGQVAFTERGRHMMSTDTRKMAEWIAHWRAKCEGSDRVSPYEMEIYNAVTRIGFAGVVDFAIPSDTLAFTIVDFLYHTLGRSYIKDFMAHKVQSRLGTRIQDEIVFTILRSIDPTVWRHSQRWSQGSAVSIKHENARKEFLKQGYNIRLWDPAFRSAVGGWFMEAFSFVTGHLFKKSKLDNGKYLHMVALHSDIWEYMSRSTDDDIMFNPRFMPTFKQTDRWVSVNDGGYAHAELQRPFILKMDDTLWEFYKDRDIGDALGAANALSSTAWSVDRDVSAVLAYFVKNNWSRAGLVESEARELPPRLPKDATHEDKKRRAMERSKVLGYNRRNVTKRAGYRRLLKLHERFDRPFFYTYRSDNRGRLYCVGEFMNPQYGDESRGTLLFADGKHVESEAGMRWLKIHGANLAGHDKLPFDERIAWVDSNQDMILGCANDPLACQEWEDTDEPFQFLSWCFDYSRVLHGGPSHTPVSLDGSNNGLQLFSLLLRDRELAEATNTVKVDRPRDIYSFVCAGILPLLNRDSLDPSSTDYNKAMGWLEFFEKHYRGQIPRSLGKRAVMTKAYNVGLFTVRRYIEDWLLENHPDWLDGRLRWVMSSYLGGLLWQVMEEKLSGASRGMDWLKASARIITAKNEVPWWRSPSGFPVFQPYYRTKWQQIKLVFGQQTRVRMVKSGLDSAKIRKHKVVNAVSPNFIHSIDAAVAHKVALEMKSRIPGASLRFIHDSFGTHAENVETLSQVIRKVLYEVFSEDRLAILKSEWEGRYGVVLPDLPAYGDLDIAEVLDAEYAYC